MTFRSARIIKKEYKGDAEESHGPGRIVYSLEGVECHIKDFVDWYQYSPDFQDFLLCPPNLLIDLGGRCKNLEEGEILTISFHEYFDGWLQSQLSDWKKSIKTKKLDLSK